MRNLLYMLFILNFFSGLMGMQTTNHGLAHELSKDVILSIPKGLLEKIDPRNTPLKKGDPAFLTHETSPSGYRFAVFTGNQLNTSGQSKWEFQTATQKILHTSPEQIFKTTFALAAWMHKNTYLREAEQITAHLIQKTSHKQRAKKIKCSDSCLHPYIALHLEPSPELLPWHLTQLQKTLENNIPAQQNYGQRIAEQMVDHLDRYIEHDAFPYYFAPNNLFINEPLKKLLITHFSLDTQNLHYPKQPIGSGAEKIIRPGSTAHDFFTYSNYELIHKKIEMDQIVSDTHFTLKRSDEIIALAALTSNKIMVAKRDQSSSHDLLEVIDLKKSLTVTTKSVPFKISHIMPLDAQTVVITGPKGMDIVNDNGQMDWHRKETVGPIIDTLKINKKKWALVTPHTITVRNDMLEIVHRLFSKNAIHAACYSDKAIFFACGTMLYQWPYQTTDYASQVMEGSFTQLVPYMDNALLAVTDNNTIVKLHLNENQLIRSSYAEPFSFDTHNKYSIVSVIDPLHLLLSDGQSYRIFAIAPLASVTDMLTWVKTHRPKECPICLEIKPLRQLSCSHDYCISCLHAFVTSHIKDQQPYIACPKPECKQEIPNALLAQIVPDTKTLNLLYDIQFRAWLIKHKEAFKQCPTPDCSFAFLNERTDQSTIECPQCEKKYCAQCLSSHSVRITCQDARTTCDKGLAEIASQEWKQKYTRECPSCKTAIEKNKGCNHMTCQQCKHEFCWLCLKPYQQPGHGPFNCTLPPAAPVAQAAPSEEIIVLVNEHMIFARDPLGYENHLPRKLQNVRFAKRFMQLRCAEQDEWTAQITQAYEHMRGSTLPEEEREMLWLHELEKIEQRSSVK